MFATATSFPPHLSLVVKDIVGFTVDILIINTDIQCVKQAVYWLRIHQVASLNHKGSGADGELVLVNPHPVLPTQLQNFCFAIYVTVEVARGEAVASSLHYYTTLLLVNLHKLPSITLGSGPRSIWKIEQDKILPYKASILYYTF